MDKLVGDRIHHPSLRLGAGQVVGFVSPTTTAARCTVCGQPFTNKTYHPNYTWTAMLSRIDSMSAVHAPTVARL